VLADLSTSLRNELVAYSNGKIVYALDTFQDADPTLVTLLVTRMRPLFHMRQDVVFREQEQGRDIFFLVRGSVQIIVADPGIRPLQYLRKQSRRKRRLELMRLADCSRRDKGKPRNAVQYRPNDSSRNINGIPEFSGVDDTLEQVQNEFLNFAPARPMEKVNLSGLSASGSVEYLSNAKRKQHHAALLKQKQRSRRLASGDSWELGTVDADNVPGVEDEVSVISANSGNSGWTGYSFLSSRPGSHRRNAFRERGRRASDTDIGMSRNSRQAAKKQVLRQ